MYTKVNIWPRLSENCQANEADSLFQFTGSAFNFLLNKTIILRPKGLKFII